MQETLRPSLRPSHRSDYDVNEFQLRKIFTSPGRNFFQKCVKRGKEHFKSSKSEKNGEEFPKGNAFPRDLSPTRQFFNDIETSFMTKKNFLSADILRIEDSSDQVLPEENCSKPYSALKAAVLRLKESTLNAAGATNSASEQVKPVDSSSTAQLVEPLKTSSSRKIPKSAYKVKFPKRIGRKPDKMKCGNFLLATLDISIWTDQERGQTYIAQLGCTTSPPNGNSFETWTYPHDLPTINSPFQLAIQQQMYFLGKLEGVKGSRFPVSRVSDLKSGLMDLLAFIKKECYKVRPPYDGAIIYTHNAEAIKILARSLGQFKDVQSEFLQLVKGYGAFSEFVRATVPATLTTEETCDDFKLTLAETSIKVIGKICGVRGDENSNTMHEILLKLLGEKPNLTNFFSKYTYMTDSNSFAKLLMLNPPKLYEQRHLKYCGLQAFLAERLYDDEDKIVVLGLDDLLVTAHFMSRAEWLADGIIRALLASKLDFEDLLECFTKEGMQSLDTKIQSEFLRKNLSYQSSYVIAQTTRAAKLILEFFSKTPLSEMSKIGRVHSKLKPVRVSQAAWDSYKPMREINLRGMFPKVPLKPLISVLSMCEVDHSKLYHIWKTDPNFLTVMDSKINAIKSRFQFPLPKQFNGVRVGRFFTFYFKTLTSDPLFKTLIEDLETYQPDKPDQPNQPDEEPRIGEVGGFESDSPEGVLYNWGPTDLISIAISNLNAKLSSETDEEKFKAIMSNKDSLNGILKFWAEEMKTMWIICGRCTFVTKLFQFIATLLAFANLNFVTLKSLHRTGNLYSEVQKVFRVHKDIMNVPILEPENVTKLISDYFQKFSYSK